MVILSRSREIQCYDYVDNFKFDNNVWVGIHKSDGIWEYQEGDDDETYLSGEYVVDGNSVIDYGGCLELPREVEAALRDLGYSIEL